MGAKNKSNEQNQKIILKGLLISLLFLQIVFLSWIINNILLWSDLDFEDVPILYSLFIPIIIILVILPIFPKLMKYNNLIHIIRRYFLLFGLIGQIIIDYLLYGSLNNIFLLFGGLEFGGSLPAGWLSINPTPVVLSVIWILITFTFVVPSILINLYCHNDSDQHHKLSWHLGYIIFSIIMITRIGSTWSMPYNHLIWTGLMFPFLIYITLNNSREIPKQNDRMNMMVLPSSSILVILFFWIIEEQVFSGNSLSLGLVWIAPLVTNIIILLNIRSESKKIERLSHSSSDDVFKLNRTIFGGLYASILIITCCLILVSLNSWFAELSLIWFILGLSCLSFIPEILLLQKTTQSSLKAPDFIRYFFWILSSIIGMVFPLVISIYDPISTYFSFIIIGINAIFVIPTYIKNQNTRIL